MLLLVLGIAPYLSGYLTGLLLGLTGHPNTWTRWWEYMRVLDQPAYAPYAWRIYLAGGFGIGIPVVAAIAGLRTLRRRLPEPRPPRFEPLEDIALASRHGVVLARGIATEMSVLVAASQPERAVLGTLLPTLRQTKGPRLLVGTPDVLAACASAIRGRDVVHLAPFAKGHRWNPLAAAWAPEGLRIPVLDSLAERWYPATDPSKRFLASHAQQAFVALARIVDDVLRAHGERVPPAPGDLYHLTQPLTTGQRRAYVDALAGITALSERTREALRPWRSLDDAAFRLVCDALRAPLTLFGHAPLDEATRGDDISGRDLRQTVVLIEVPDDRRAEASHLIDTFMAWWRHATHGAPHRRIVIDGLDAFARLPVLLDSDLPCLATIRRPATLRPTYGREFDRLLKRFPCVVMHAARDETAAQEGEAMLEAYMKVHDPRGRGLSRPACTQDLQALAADQQLVIAHPRGRAYAARIPSARRRITPLPIPETGEPMPFPKPLASLLASLLAACSAPTPDVADGKRPKATLANKGCNSIHDIGSPPTRYVDACLGPHRFRLPQNLYSWQAGQDLVGTSVGLNVQWPSLEPLPLGEDYHDDNHTFMSNINIDIHYEGHRTYKAFGPMMRRAIEPLIPGDPSRKGNPDENIELRIKGDPVYGLTPYYADFDLIEPYYKKLYGEDTKAIRPSIHHEWFIHTNEDGIPSTIIICDSRKIPDGTTIEKDRIVDLPTDRRAQCSHRFVIPEYGVIVYVDYLRVVMHDWQRIESRIRYLLKSTEIR